MSLWGALRFRDRRSKERFWIVVLFFLVLFFGFLEGWFFQLQPDLPLSGNIFLFALINLNVILLLLLAYLVLRNIVKLVFERKKRILGHKLKTRLVVAFVGVALIPTLPLFWLATQFIFSSLDYWFSHRVEQSLEQSVSFAKEYLELEQENLRFDGPMVRSELEALIRQEHPSHPTAESQLRSLVERYHLEVFVLVNESGEFVLEFRRPESELHDFEILRRFVGADLGRPSSVQTVNLQGGRELLICQLPFPMSGSDGGETQGKLFLVRMIPPHITEKLRTIGDGYEDYLQLKLLHKPLKRSHFITFSIVTLLVVFGAIWMAFYLAKNITIPLEALVAGTQSVANGDLSVQLESAQVDELGMLISSFNKMVRDLREGREQLASAYEALQEINAELDDRRRYMEIVLKNIAASVISVDADGRIITLNQAAEVTFGLQADKVKGSPYSDFLQPSHMEILKSFMDLYRLTRQPHLEQQVHTMMGNRPMVLLIKASVLRDDLGQFMGVVVVLDDLTDLEKAQRMAAWREVARRIAHEIKNPLTPIKLSAQRLRRNHPELSDPPDAIFNQCTRTIIEQVDHMKHLVDEFSRFARLPRAQLTPCNLAALVEEVVSFYRHTYPHISFRFNSDQATPPLRLDRDQFKQVMVNILDNALHAVDGDRGVIEVSIFYDPILKIARLECADNGHGLSPEDRLRMFEPYYSTKDKGTGLGLAIVSSIIADHNGFVRVRDNQPQGTIIVIELPG